MVLISIRVTIIYQSRLLCMQFCLVDLGQNLWSIEIQGSNITGILNTGTL